MTDIHLKLTVEEANLVLEGLGNLAFIKVYSLVSKIQQQAQDPLATTQDSSPAQAAPGDPEARSEPMTGTSPPSTRPVADALVEPPGLQELADAC